MNAMSRKREAVSKVTDATLSSVSKTSPWPIDEASAVFSHVATIARAIETNLLARGKIEEWGGIYAMNDEERDDLVRLAEWISFIADQARTDLDEIAESARRGAQTEGGSTQVCG